MEKGQPKDTTNYKTAPESFRPSKGGENKHGQAPRQDGKNTDKKVDSKDHLWKYEHSVGKGPGKK